MSDWINFVKKLAKEKNMKYNEALKIASPLYHKEKGTSPAPKKAKSMGGGKRKHKTKDVVNAVHMKLRSGELHSKSSKKDIKNALSNKEGGCLQIFGIPVGGTGCSTD